MRRCIYYATLGFSALFAMPRVSLLMTLISGIFIYAASPFFDVAISTAAVAGRASRRRYLLLLRDGQMLPRWRIDMRLMLLI